jgi:hypothetical protein
MQTYIQVFKTKSRYANFFQILFLALSASGLVGLVLSFVFRKSFIPTLNDASYFVLLFNGLISYLLVWDSMKKSKFFVSWNDHEITYILPKSKQTEQIPIADIKALQIKNNEVVVELVNNETKLINMKSVFLS